MQSILAVVDGTERTNHTLQAAIERTEAEGGHLVVLHVTSQGEYQDKRAAIGSVPGVSGERYEWTVEQARASAADAAGRQARLAVGDRDVDWTAVGRVGSAVDATLTLAAEYDCEEVVVTESKPQWFGLRRRFERKLAAAFDGTVTPVPAPTVGVGDGVRPVPDAEV